MISLSQIAASVTAVGVIGGGALTLDNLHVAAEDFREYIEQQQMADEREYVQDLKEDIRNIRKALIEFPDEEFLLEELAELIDELCELRPDDRLCDD
jgi:hypothetical protein